MRRTTIGGRVLGGPKRPTPAVDRWGKVEHDTEKWQPGARNNDDRNVHVARKTRGGQGSHQMLRLKADWFG
jgi:hypothetical protein